MPSYSCTTCSYETAKKSSFDNHNVSKSHLKRITSIIYQPIEEVQTTDVINDETIQLKEMIKALQKQAEYDNNEILTLNRKNMKLEMELKMKDEMILFLKSYQSQPQLIKQESNINEPQVIQPLLVKPVFNVEQFLNTEMKDAYTWDQFKTELINDVQFNDVYMKNYASSKGNINIMKHADRNYYTNSSDRFMINILARTMSNIPANKRPIYCYNVRESKFFYNTKESGWIKAPNDLFDNYDHVAQKSFLTARKNTKDNIKHLFKDYGLNYDSQFNSHDDVIMLTIMTDRQPNIIQKIKTEFAKICKKDGDSFSANNSDDKSIKEEKYDTK